MATLLRERAAGEETSVMKSVGVMRRPRLRHAAKKTPDRERLMTRHIRSRCLRSESSETVRGNLPTYGILLMSATFGESAT